ncbi:MAG: tRNA (adenosine(37)-N6)-threonylcarbamoyltransferase complex dimerization subunit type 1 TsaB [Propionibacteriaceae bacterium]|nr:tRNA (adenosine(37)-N6)-threonylcarbamoyltransferase complex dimerization subunit type 1 TsaB [Propionibacteriaceae bacterium]
MTWTLAIDTSHHVAVGLARDGVPVDAEIVTDTRAHGEALMPGIVEVCRRNGLAVADVDEFVVGMGPGPFTGLRVGIVAAATLAHLSGTELHHVCSLDVLALQWMGHGAPHEFVVASDARRKELYWALQRGGARVGEPQVGTPDMLPQLPVTGPVPEAMRELLRYDAAGPTSLDPARMAAHWRELPVAPPEPYYLRPADATVGGPPKSALPKLRLR